MAYLFFRLESSAAAGNSFLSRAIFRSKNSFRAGGYHRTMSSVNSKQLPRLILPPALEGGTMVDRFYNLANDRVEQGGGIRIKEEEEILGCSHGWLALFNYSSNIDISLSNPLTRRHIKLPPLRTLFLADYKNRPYSASKVTLSCSPDDDEEEECRAVMAYRLGADAIINRLAFCLPGRSTHWTFIYKLDETIDEDCDDEELDEITARGYGDIIYSSAHKLFFCITKSNCFQIWNLQQQDTPPWIEFSRWIGELTSPPELREILERSVDKPDVRRQKNLVFDHRSNQLLLVRRHVMQRVGHDGAYVKPHYYGYRRGFDDSYPYKTIAFDVHKVEWDIKSREINLTYMEGAGSLNGLALFIGKNDSFALSAAEYPGLIPNSIYFTDPNGAHVPLKLEKWASVEPPHPRWVEMMYGGHDVGIFNYENKTFSPCYYPLDSQSIKRITPKPFCSSYVNASCISLRRVRRRFLL